MNKLTNKGFLNLFQVKPKEDLLQNLHRTHYKLNCSCRLVISKEKDLTQSSGQSILTRTPSSWGNQLLGFVFCLHHPFEVGIAEDEGPVDDG